MHTSPRRLSVVGAAVLAVAAAAAAPPDTVPPTPVPAAPPESCLPRETVDDRTAVLGGTTSHGAEWVAAFGIDDRGIQLVCVDLTLDGEEMARGVLGGPFDAADDAGEVVVDVLTAGLRGGPHWFVVRGTVTADADRVTLSIAGAEPVDAQIADTGPESGWRWYAAAVPVAERTTFPDIEATAYSDDGEEIATGESVYSRTRD